MFLDRKHFQRGLHEKDRVEYERLIIENTDARIILF